MHPPRIELGFQASEARALSIGLWVQKTIFKNATGVLTCKRYTRNDLRASHRCRVH